MRFHPFMFLLNPWAANWKIHQLRDGSAANQIFSAHEKMGFARMAERFNSVNATWPAILSVLDFFLVATRPPLSDKKDDQRKIIQRSGSAVENAILNRILAYFAYLERGRAILTREMRDALTLRDRSDVSFARYGRAFTQYRDFFASSNGDRIPTNPNPWRTIGYVVCDQLWENGPFFRCCFAMDGATNLAFCYLLRTRHADLLNGIGLSMVELVGRIPPEADSLEFPDSWGSHVLLDRVATKTPPPKTMEEACRVAPLCGPDFLAAFNGQWVPSSASPAVS